jgi:hypothetical protein
VNKVTGNPIGWLGWLWRAALAVLLAVTVMGHVERVVAILTKTNFNSERSLGVVGGPPTVREVGWTGLAQVLPNGPAAAAGLRPGDSVRFDQFLGHVIPWRPGERVSVTVARGGRRFPATVLIGAPLDFGRAVDVIELTFAIGGVIASGFCAVLMMRGWRNRAALQLTTVLLLMFSGAPVLWLPHTVAALLVFMTTAAIPAVMYAWPMFCLEISGGPSSRRQLRLAQEAGLVLAVLMLCGFSADLLLLPLPAAVPPLEPLTIVLVNLVGYAILAANYGRNDAPARNRIRIVALAFACFLIATLLSRLGAASMQAGTPLTELLGLGMGLAALQYVALILLTYAVLRRRLFDLGFALNRTLVYGAVSFILLACFGLAEWAVDHVIPESWRGASAIYSAGIALVLFLSFHRLRDAVERQVERLFFHRWQQNEAALRRFVGAAGHFDQSPALCLAFAEEASRFAEGAPAALYLRGAQGAFRLQCGRPEGSPDACADDDPAFALMRAERRPVDLAAAHAKLAGALALPMLDQGLLAGFVLMGPKPDGADYRPDEIELLGWAANQVGLDLQALRARDLEAQVVSLKEDNLGLSEKVTSLAEDKARLTALLTDVARLRPASPAT